MTRSYEPEIVDSQEAWEQLNRELPQVVDELLASEVYSASNPPRLTGRGIYLFSNGDEHLYVGRTGITARSRKAKREPSTSFTARWKQHTGFGSHPNSAPFAMKLTRDLATHFEVMQPEELKKAGVISKTADWWGLRKDDQPPDFYFAYQEAKRFIREDLEYRVVELIDDLRGVRSHITEVYVDVILQTTYGDFSPS